MKIPPVKVIFEPEDRKSILSEIDRVLASGMVAAGSNVQKFEGFWAEYTDTRHAVSCSNGGAALEMILKDTHTCQYHPERFDRWTQIAREVVEESAHE